MRGRQLHPGEEGHVGHGDSSEPSPKVLLNGASPPATPHTLTAITQELAITHYSNSSSSNNDNRGTDNNKRKKIIPMTTTTNTVTMTHITGVNKERTETKKHVRGMRGQAHTIQPAPITCTQTFRWRGEGRRGGGRYTPLPSLTPAAGIHHDHQHETNTTITTP